MESRIAQAVHLKIPPVGLLWADEKPARAMMFQPGKWGCVMWLVAAAAKGKTAASDFSTFGCVGGGVGLGFGNQYRNFPDGEEGFCHFLSMGNAEREGGAEMAEQVRPFLRDEAFEHFLHGEGYVRDPALVRRFLTCLPMRDIPARYVVLKPLADVDPARENLRTVIFFVDPDRLSALVVLANYGRGDNENVVIPYAAGCQTIGIYPYREAESPCPRGVVGLTDLSARLYLRKQLGSGFMTFAAPKALFEEMEGNVKGSFLERSTWQGILSEP